MTEVVVAPDTEAIVIGYLSGGGFANVYASVPATRPQSFLRVSAAGGPGFTGHILFRGDVTVEAWDVKRGDASSLVRTACARLESSFEFYAEADSPVWFPDPQTGTPRYVALVHLALPGVVTP